MPTIKAPFNFVPLSEEVYTPEWGSQISHDKPFSDGISGIIKLNITAESPIFVRNGHTRKDAEDKTSEYRSFSHLDNRYFIPATSLKGSIRNVLEIMSFGKIHLDKKAMYAQRDWDNEILYTLRSPKVQNEICCGWLRSKGNDYEIIDCDKPYRISHKRIDEYLGDSKMTNYFSQSKGIDLSKPFLFEGKPFDPKTAIFKYKLLEGYELQNLTFTKDIEKNKGLRYSSNGEIKGDIVLTGQPDSWLWPRKDRGGKFYEFVFLDKQVGSYNISKSDFDHFKFIYVDSPDWAHAKEQLKGKGIPVFFRKTVQKEKIEIKDFGLAYLYKLPYENSPYDLLNDEHKKTSSMDLAECIFGSINENALLKGRVLFTNAFTEKAEIGGDDISLSLGSPKASYYPFYIRQNGANGETDKYETYNDGKLAGWKRYPVREKTWKANTGNEKIDTPIRPLGKDTKFDGKIKFHNLREIELGALLSALTFHGTEGCFHQIGQGKPFGFGKVSIKATLIGDRAGEEIEFMAKFEEALLKKMGNWCSSRSIVELFTMAHEQIVGDGAQFRYMSMNTDPELNDFINIKKKKEFLQPYSILRNACFKPNSLYLMCKEQAERKEQDRLSKLSPDNREKEKYEGASSTQYGSLINDSLANVDLTKDFFQWLKDELISEKIWKIDGDAKKDKNMKRCQCIEEQISNRGMVKE
jgi:CRISPR-associated protein (TIGR03986 family)